MRRENKLGSLGGFARTMAIMKSAAYPSVSSSWVRRLMLNKNAAA